MAITSRGALKTKELLRRRCRPFSQLRRRRRGLTKQGLTGLFNGVRGQTLAGIRPARGLRLIPAQGLRLVKGSVGPGQQRRQAVVFFLPVRNAYAGRPRYRLALLARAVQALCNEQGAIEIRVWENRHEFVSAETGEPVGVPQGCLCLFREIDQHVVSLEMAVRVVDGFEFIQVDKHDRKLGSVAFGTGYLLVKRFGSGLFIETLR